MASLWFACHYFYFQSPVPSEGKMGLCVLASNFSTLFWFGIEMWYTHKQYLKEVVICHWDFNELKNIAGEDEAAYNGGSSWLEIMKDIC